MGFRKYTYIFKDGAKTYSEEFTNDMGIEKNVKNAEALAKTYGWKLHAVREKR